MRLLSQAAQKVVSIVHTEEGDRIHLISMRKATKREREIYFQSIAN